MGLARLIPGFLRPKARDSSASREQARAAAYRAAQRAEEQERGILAPRRPRYTIQHHRMPEKWWRHAKRRRQLEREGRRNARRGR